MGEEKIFGAGAFHLLLWLSPIASPSPFLLTTAKAAWLLLKGSSWKLYLNTLLMCKLSSSINREAAVNVLYLPGQSPTEPSGSWVINAPSLSQPSGNSCQGTQPGMRNLPVWINGVGIISGLMPGYGPPIYYFLHLILGVSGPRQAALTTVRT